MESAPSRVVVANSNLEASGTIRTQKENRMLAGFKAVFEAADGGDPSDCHVALWQYQLLDSASEEPKMDD